MRTVRPGGVEGSIQLSAEPPDNNLPKKHRWGYRLGRLILVVVLTYVAVCLIVAALQTRFIYFPTATYRTDPSDIGLRFERVSITTDDGIELAAWYVPHPAPLGTLLFLHGNAGNISDRLASIQLLKGMNLNVLIVDYRGYGESGGSPTERGTYRDAEAAWDYLTRTRGESPDRVVVFGRSLGGAVAIELANRHEPACLIVESSFTRLADVGRRHYPLLPVGWLLRHEYDSISKVASIHCLKLFIHGRDDSLIPIDMGRRLFDAAAPPKRFLETPGDHNESGFAYSSETTEELAKFVRDVLQSPSPE